MEIIKNGASVYVDKYKLRKRNFAYYFIIAILVFLLAYLLYVQFFRKPGIPDSTIHTDNVIETGKEKSNEFKKGVSDHADSAKKEAQQIKDITNAEIKEFVESGNCEAIASGIVDELTLYRDEFMRSKR